FHASYKDIGGKLIEVGVGNALVGHYLSQLGFDQRAVIFATSAPPEQISWIRDENGSQSGITFERFTADGGQKNQTSGIPELSELQGSDDNSHSRAAYNASSTTGRSVRFFAGALTTAGYKAELDTS